jgi:hypothetical protein
MMKIKTLIIAALVSCFACTEKIPIAPEYTGDTDWVPTLQLAGNNYGRIGVTFEHPPRLELERNIERYIYELRKKSDPAYTTFDSLEVSFLYRGFLPDRYISPQILEENTGYSFRVVIKYRNGARQASVPIGFNTPILKSSVIERVSAAQISGAPFYPNALAFWNDSLYIVHEDSLIYLDTENGNATVLARNFQPVEDDRFCNCYQNLPIHNGIVVLTENLREDNDPIILRFYNLSTRQFEKSFVIPKPFPEPSLGKAFHYDGQFVYIMWFDERLARVAKLDAVTGNEVERFSSITNVSFAFNEMLVVGNDLWLAADYDTTFYKFDNRILKIDLRTSNIVETMRNPIFDTSGLAWDGAHFWTYDHESNAFVKLELEGI